MRATFDLKGLAAAFKTVVPFASDTDLKPVVSCAKLICMSPVRGSEATDCSWSLEATNLEMGAKLTGVGAITSEPGACLLPAEKICAALSLMNDEIVTVETHPRGVTVSCGRSRYLFPATDPAKFPSIKEFDAGAYYEVGGTDLKTLLAKTAFAVSNADMLTPEKCIQYKTSGALLSFDGDGVRVVALDGKTLATGKIDANSVGTHEDEGRQHIIPYEFAAAAAKVIGENTVKIALTKNTAAFSAGNLTLSTLLLEGRYPPWKMLLGDPARKTTITTRWGPLRDAIRRAIVVVDELDSRVFIEFGEKVLTVETKSPNCGMSKSEIEVSCAKPTKLILSASILKPIIKAIPNDSEVSIEIEDKDKVVLIREGDYLYAAMPMSI